MQLLYYTIRAGPGNYYFNVLRCIHGRSIANRLIFSLMSRFDGLNYSLHIRNIGVILNFILCDIKFLYSCRDYDLFYLGCKVKYACSLSDIDECKEGHDIKMKKCHPNASCINTQGSYNCSCNPTYTGSGFECKGTFGFLQPHLSKQYWIKSNLSLLRWPLSSNSNSDPAELMWVSMMTVLASASDDILHKGFSISYCRCIVIVLVHDRFFT